MNLGEQAFQQLYPEKTSAYQISVKYSRRFKSYNANVRIRSNALTFNFSRMWKEVDKDIQIGLMQELLVRVVKDKRKTMQMDIYHTFIKSLPAVIPKKEDDPILSASFSRTNEKYFNGLVEKPNLAFGNATTTKLGHYNFHTDTIEISSIFRKAEPALLDAVMHHEMLHKHLQYEAKPGRSRYHTSLFRQKEKEFENFYEVEKGLRQFLAKLKVKRWFWG